MSRDAREQSLVHAIRLAETKIHAGTDVNAESVISAAKLFEEYLDDGAGSKAKK